MLALQALGTAARADLVPERRRDYYARAANEYLVVPAVASLPGLGVFVGVIGSAANIQGTGTDAAVAVAESVSGSDIHIQALDARELPLIGHNLTLEYQYADIKLGNFQAFLPGRNSPNFTIPVTAEFHVQGVRPTVHLWERRINVTYSLSYFDGFNFDSDGNQVATRNYGAATTLALDFTDDVINPLKGVRLDYRTSLQPPSFYPWGAPTSSGNLVTSSDKVQVETYTLTGYLPATDRLDLVGDAEFGRAIGGDPNQIVSGGSPPLRGYAGGRWSDRYSIFGAAEARYTVPVNRMIDVAGLAHGLLEGLQGAVFYEIGQVSPTNNDLLYEDMHADYGIGLRAVFQSIILRFDIAIGSEGAQTSLTINQPF
ncbi:MAG TPA: hypothetical protein VL359_09490 [bacterium]|nr:hypothetical protein [bacterium]